MHSLAPTLLRLDGRTVDLQCGSVTDQARHTVILRPQAAEVLRLLALKPGTLVTKDELMQAVWGDIAVTDDSLVQCVTEIRKALGDEKHEVVRTILKRGYVFEVTRHSKPVQARSFIAWIGLAASLVAVAALTGIYFLPARKLAAEPPAIAVLPFENISGGERWTRFADGMTEDIITDLARFRDIPVIARTSTEIYRGKPHDVRDIGKALDGGEHVCLRPEGRNTPARERGTGWPSRLHDSRAIGRVRWKCSDQKLRPRASEDSSELTTMDTVPSTNLRLDGRTVDLQCGSVTDQAGHTVILRPQAAEVLRLLALRSGTLVTKDELMQAVWGDIAVTDDSLVQCITEIRKALGDEKHEIVRTILKRGYVFEPGTQPGRRDRHRLITAVIGVAAIMAAMLWLAKPTPSPAPERLPSIAVLPFDDMSQDKSLAYMGDGVAEDIISMLARAPDVMVIARNSSFTYGGQPSDVRKIGRELGVDYVLEGSVRKEADKMRIVAQLNDTKTGKHLWAERFDKAGADPPPLQDEVTGKIIAALTGERGQLKQSQYREAWGTDTAALAEYDYYLRAHDVYMKAETKDENDRAGRIWEEGLTKFPNSTLIKVKLGWYHWTSAWNWWSDDLTADFRKANSLVREVLAEDNLTPQVRRLAHWLFAFVLMREGDFGG